MGQERGRSSLFKSDQLVTWTPRYSLFYIKLYSTVYRTVYSELYNLVFGTYLPGFFSLCSHISEMTVTNRQSELIFLKKVFGSPPVELI